MQTNNSPSQHLRDALEQTLSNERLGAAMTSSSARGELLTALQLAIANHIAEAGPGELDQHILVGFAHRHPEIDLDKSIELGELGIDDVGGPARTFNICTPQIDEMADAIADVLEATLPTNIGWEGPKGFEPVDLRDVAEDAAEAVQELLDLSPAPAIASMAQLSREVVAFVGSLVRRVSADLRSLVHHDPEEALRQLIEAAPEEMDPVDIRRGFFEALGAHAMPDEAADRIAADARALGEGLPLPSFSDHDPDEGRGETERYLALESTPCGLAIVRGREDLKCYLAACELLEKRVAHLVQVFPQGCKVMAYELGVETRELTGYHATPEAAAVAFRDDAAADTQELAAIEEEA
jgi:hypothetical protein